MPATAPALTALAGDWGALAPLHSRIETCIERAL